MLSISCPKMEEELNIEYITQIRSKLKEDYDINLRLETVSSSACDLSTCRILKMSYRDYHCNEEGKKVFEMLKSDKRMPWLKVEGPFVDDLLEPKQYEPLLDTNYFYSIIIEPLLKDHKLNTLGLFLLNQTIGLDMIERLNKNLKNKNYTYHEVSDTFRLSTFTGSSFHVFNDITDVISALRKTLISLKEDLESNKMNKYWVEIIEHLEKNQTDSMMSTISNLNKDCKPKQKNY